jgi:hypothetical protein
MPDDAATKAMLSAGRDAAKRAMSDLLLTDEEREARDAEEAAAAKKKRTKRIVFGVLGLFLVIGVVGLMLAYWQYFLLAGVLGFAGWFGIRRLRNRREPAEAPVKKAARVEVEPKANALEDRAERLRALEEERVRVAQETEEELAALKARLSK